MSEIDVSECEYKYKDSCNLYEKECKYITDCLYRQLQQLNQLCQQKTVDNFELIKENQQLKAKNEELRKMNHGLSEKFANVCGGCFEQELREKYKQCLDEIEKLQKELCSRCDLTFCPNTICYEILQKIKEVKGDE